ncbi:MAG: AAA family ATPase [Micromonosporaceae bacterium]|nr:AAA family ATPase [Micromonosporaceae bacterium]
MTDERWVVMTDELAERVILAHEARQRRQAAAAEAEPRPAGERHGPVVVRASAVRPERVSWLWPGYLPAGKLVTLSGDPALGKSTVALDLAARVSRGSAWPDGQPGCEPGEVAVLSAEDGVADTIVPRLAAAGADLGRVAIIPAVRDEAGLRLPEIPRDLDALAEAVPGVRLLIVDPLNAYLHETVDAYRDHSVRRALAPLAEFAERTGACVLVVRHWTKSPGRSIYRGNGSIAFVAAARVGLVAAADPNDETGTRRILAVEKSNIAAAPSALAYTLDPDPERGCARITWHGTADYTADDLSAAVEADRSRIEEAEAYLLAALEDGPQPSSEVRERAARLGLTPRTLQRALKRVGVVVERSGYPARTTWALPDDPPAPVATTPVAPTPHTRFGATVGATEDSAQPCGFTAREESSRANPGVYGATDATDATEPRCPVCGSTELGPISGACRRCGFRPWELRGLFGDEGGAS